ncbi:MAG: type II secretion system protein [Candidatus Pacebacteria bacterium]|nr:type II secretion system protein [Candidatus Paceibacterota bacterium]
MKKGFTLIELLVVIAIIGILSSVVLASLNSAREKARDARRVSDLGQIALAMEMYYNDNTNYPATIADLQTGGFLPAVPVDPTSGAGYTYAPVGTPATDYCLSATLENTAAVPDNDAVCDAGGNATDAIYSVAP